MHENIQLIGTDGTSYKKLNQNSYTLSPQKSTIRTRAIKKDNLIK